MWTHVSKRVKQRGRRRLLAHLALECGDALQVDVVLDRHRGQAGEPFTRALGWSRTPAVNPPLA